MHEDFEKETIRSCVLRHQLKVLPGQIREEIMSMVWGCPVSKLYINCIVFAAVLVCVTV